MRKGQIEDLTGRTFGRLTVLEFDHITEKGTSYWKCQCSCPDKTIKVVSRSNLLSGATQSCGCYNLDRTKESNTKHGGTKTKLFSVWNNMRQRCTKPNNHAWGDYGGRGIRVYDEWQEDFAAFQEWAFANGYKEGLTLDRIDNDGNYEPANCQWIDMKEQSNNRRSNHFISYKGKEKTISQWAEQLGVSKVTLRWRLEKYKWDLEKALEIPLNKHDQPTARKTVAYNSPDKRSNLGQIKDLTGQVFGRLTVVEFSHREPPHTYWKCICECKNEVLAKASKLQGGSTTSCGCLTAELRRKPTKHSGAGTRLYHTWTSMRNRCLSPKTSMWEYYGGRGITICDEWMDSFNTFEKWALENGYTDKLTIDRINPDGNYEPANCRWATPMEQGANKRNNRFITYQGETKTLMQWVRELGISKTTLMRRLEQHNGNMEEALKEPWNKRSSATNSAGEVVDNRLLLEYNGEKKTIAEWAEHLGIRGPSLWARLKRHNYNMEEAMSNPRNKY